MSARIRLFEQKIEEYLLSCYPDLANKKDKSFLRDWKLYKFSITTLHNALSAELQDCELAREVGEKLIDIKLHYAYLLTIHEHFYRGTTLLVCNDEIEKLNPHTISMLRGVHYRVFLLSVLLEQILDLLWLIIERKQSNHKKKQVGQDTYPGPSGIRNGNNFSRRCRVISCIQRTVPDFGDA